MASEGGGPGRWEAVLAETWCEVLGVGRVREADDFFRLGGESLMLVHLLGRVRDRTGTQVPLDVPRLEQVEFALQQSCLLVEIVRAQQDVLQIPIVMVLAEARRTFAPRRFGLDPAREFLGRDTGIADGGADLGAVADDAGVAEVLPILAPYKMASREVRPEPVVECCGERGIGDVGPAWIEAPEEGDALARPRCTLAPGKDLDALAPHSLEQRRGYIEQRGKGLLVREELDVKTVSRTR